MFYRYMSFIHRDNICLKEGSLIPIIAEDNLIIYARTYGENIAVVIVYTGEENKNIEIPMYLAGIRYKDRLSRLMYSDEEGYNAGKLNFVLDDDYLEIELKKNLAVLYIAE